MVSCIWKLTLASSEATLDYAYGVKHSWQLTRGVFDRSKSGYTKQGIILCPDKNGKEGICRPNRALDNADSYAMLGAGVYFTKNCRKNIPLLPGTERRLAVRANLPATPPLPIAHGTCPADPDPQFEVPPEEGDGKSYQPPFEPAPPAAAPPLPAPPTPADTCGCWYKFFFDHFEIYGKNFDAAKLGNDGSGLKSHLQHCGDLTSWSFEQRTNDPHGYQWFASGNLPIETKSCVGSAVVAAGGSSPDGCTGAG